MAKNLEWSAKQLSSSLKKEAGNQPEFFKGLYERLKQTSNLLAQLWGQGFDKETIQTSLNTSLQAWGRGLTHLTKFLKQHQINTNFLESEIPQEFKDGEEQIDKKNLLLNHQPKKRCALGGVVKLDWFNSTVLKLALKDERSCLIASEAGRLMLIENEHLKYESKDWLKSLNIKRQKETHDGSQNKVDDLAYCSDQNAYFLNLSGLIFKKDIDEKEPSIFLEVCPVTDDCNHIPLLLRYSKKLKSLFSTIYVPDQNGQYAASRICKINLSTKEVERMLPDYFPNSSHPETISDFAILETTPPRVLIAYHSGHMVLDKIEGSVSCGYKWLDPAPDHQKFETHNISLCPNKNYFLVFCRHKRSDRNKNDKARCRIFQILDDSVQLRDSLGREADAEDLAWNKAGFEVEYFYHFTPSFFNFAGDHQLNFLQIFDKLITSPDESSIDQTFFREISFDILTGKLQSRLKRRLSPVWLNHSRMRFMNGKVYFFDPRGFLDAIDGQSLT